MTDGAYTSAIILAGGHSTRLGRDKASEVVAGRTLLQHVYGRVAQAVDEVVVVKRRGQVLPPLDGDAVVVEDRYPDAGPLGGLVTGLAAMTAPISVAVATDMPLLAPALLRELLRLAAEHDAVVPVVEGRVQPLCAAYRKDAAAKLEGLLRAGERRLTAAVDSIEPLYVSDEAWRRFDTEGRSFLNVNTEADLERVRRILGTSGG